MRRPKLSNILCALTVGLMCLLVTGREVCAQDGGADEAQQEETRRQATTQGRGRNTGEQVLPQPSKDSFDVKVSAPPRINNVPKFAPATGVRQLMGEEMSKFYGDLRDLPVATMLQTYAMVENGGYQGFLGALTTTNGMMNNIVGTTLMQLETYRAMASDNPNELGFVEHVYKSQKSGANEDIWPAAVFAAQGEKLDQNAPAFDQYEPPERPTGSSPQDADSNSTANPGGGGGSTPATPGGPTLLSALIFARQPGEEEVDSDTSLTVYERRFKNLVGDYEIKSNPDGTVDSVSSKVILPPDTMPYGEQCKGKRGFDAFLCEQTRITWQSLNHVMYHYCDFKQRNPNQGVEIFKKQRPADHIPQQYWDDLQSDGVGLSINLVDQFFKLAMRRTRIEDQETVDCKKLFNLKGESQVKDPPKEYSETENNFDDCGEEDGGDEAKPCQRNIMLYTMAQYIGEQKSNVYYRNLAYVTMMRASQRAANHAQLAGEAFCSNLQLPIPCNPIEEFNIRIAENRVEWGDFLTYFSKLAQGAGNGAVFKPLSNNISSYAQGGTGR